VGHEADRGEMGNVYRILIGKSEGKKRPFKRCKHIWEITLTPYAGMTYPYTLCSRPSL
jgi:hypothetical protein